MRAATVEEEEVMVVQSNLISRVASRVAQALEEQLQEEISELMRTLLLHTKRRPNSCTKRRQFVGVSNDITKHYDFSLPSYF